jgi:hypothetical protein
MAGNSSLAIFSSTRDMFSPDSPVGGEDKFLFSLKVFSEKAKRR